MTDRNPMERSKAGWDVNCFATGDTVTINREPTVQYIVEEVTRGGRLKLLGPDGSKRSVLPRECAVIGQPLDK